MQGKLITHLCIHCTASPEGREMTAADIRRVHLSPPPVGRGWKQVGYVAMLHLDGTIAQLVDVDDNDYMEPREITNGILGENSHIRSIVYVGGVAKDGKTPKDTRTLAQLATLDLFVKDWLKKHPKTKLCGHNQFANKACPSFDVPAWAESIGIPKENIEYKRL